MSIGSFASILECNGSDESSDSSWDKMAIPIPIPTVAAATTTTATTTATATRASVHVDDANEMHTPPTNGSSKPVLQLQDTTFSEPLPSAFPSKQSYLAPLSLSGSSTPIRKIRLHSESSEIGARKNPTLGKSLGRKKKTISVHSSEDINPLAPCGACNEWLKKIAESNPYFRVVTFTDTNCKGVYVSPVL